MLTGMGFNCERNLPSTVGLCLYAFLFEVFRSWWKILDRFIKSSNIIKSSEVINLFWGTNSGCKMSSDFGR